ncbi:hypothetical protein FSP39_003834 [Pinctada imbricata]|uniref:Uncharacterized protein n=1 Tax=Pinctada imbricata TaxID=66713 RepID=A0AA88Y6A1_PINIB|nr:hypothetical protein FSP39_003834 [Pinctada imbricata]
MGSLGRRKSTFKQVTMAAGSMNARRLTKAIIDLPEEKDSSTPKPKVRLENTYKMKPDEETVFSSCKVETEVDKLLHDHLDDVTYDSKLCGNLCRDLSQHIRNKIKNMDFPRYKIICNVFIGQCMDQGLEVASRCLWDDKVDNCASVSYKNKSIFCIALIHGAFLE